MEDLNIIIVSLRIVTNIERVYKNFRGLNLSYEVKEGILKHCSKREL